jgi:RNA polymerase sigma factor (sigma-70 family)
MNANTALVKTGINPAGKEGRIHVFRPDHIDDQTLWNSFRNGDEQAFVIIFDRNVKPLYNYGMKIIADGDLVKDEVQSLFIELWKTRQNLGETDSIKFYLYKSIRRKLIRAKSKQENRLLVKLPVQYTYETFPSQELNFVEEETCLEKKQRVIHLLNTLTRRQREAVFLRYFEEMEYEKIAVVMRLSKQVVYNLVHRAIAALRNNLAIVSGLLFFFD